MRSDVALYSKVRRLTVSEVEQTREATLDAQFTALERLQAEKSPAERAEYDALTERLGEVLRERGIL
jgi:hypothetical protein